MKFIPTSVHGALDYLTGAALLAAPHLFGFSDYGGAAVLVPRVLGVIVLLQSLLTRYECGLLKVLPMRVHLMNDHIASIFLAASPWIFGFNHAANNVWVPHVAAGALYFLVTLMTERAPRSLRAADAAPAAGAHTERAAH